MRSSHLHDLSVVIPVYNEVDNVEELYKEIEAALPAERFLYEVIFIDDGSTDGTVARLQELAKVHANLRAVFHKRNYGQSAALVSGARAARYSMLVTLDGDGQNDPADIPRLFEQLQDSRTVVLGNRKKRDDNGLRKISSRIGNGVRRSLLKDECPDTGCSLKLFPKDAFLTLPHFNHLHRFLPALFKRAGYKLVNLPVNHRSRWHGVSKYGVMNRLFVGIHDLIGVRWLLKRPCAPEVSTHEK
ncbi:Undecaprenyl-phosphate 4-deoxy-4-formamido-L-arabinose transferase [Legionella massiliensis]|uniref:Undecaprenyl-phosphate 4-deoxy-4-formamido-L-arabinose transferase n=1 Tax=Legionella massiliensis TaxID=1034943 RepID=A0A078L0F2_9GAMM|nr:glycosyltransferase family 2 protein [Legionella massiliensis]CDZ78636.1 Undecaprenyl-phosphate 4-deoxy-4-formamido-L-arabinose transferase [Legionella massiliensis]CEE14374.1 Undecaprenyl-phosphate 4-deoxy-4-formamido-L-arabinose transferase [Legionella massiliensis]